MLPGMGNLRELAAQKPDEGQLNRIEAIIGSMTPEERRRADVINGSRRKRIARGQRHDGRGSQPAAEAVRADAEDAEAWSAQMQGEHIGAAEDAGRTRDAARAPIG